MKFEIFAGLSGGFGGARYRGVEDFEDYNDAEQYAYEMAVDEYEEHTGLNGVKTLEDFMKEAKEMAKQEGFDPEDDDYASEVTSIAEELYTEERESWLDYYVNEIDD